MALLDQRKAPLPYVFQEFPKWLTDPNHVDPEDHSKGRTLVRSAEEEQEWYEKHGLLEPIKDEETAESEPEPAAKPVRKRR